eukprot:scaffold365_cov283-Prasinococcus_capsulatus_cf.AAC.1
MQAEQEVEWRAQAGGGFGLAGGSQAEWAEELARRDREERALKAQGKRPWLEAKDWENPEKPLRPGHLYAAIVDDRETARVGGAGDPWAMDRRMCGPADCWRSEVESVELGAEVVGCVEALSFRCGAYVDFGCEYHGLVHLYEDDWVYNSALAAALRLGTKVRARVSWVAPPGTNPHRFRFPVELELLEPAIDHLLAETPQRKRQALNFTIFETLKMAEVVGDDFWLSSSADLEQDNLSAGRTMLEEDVEEEDEEEEEEDDGDSDDADADAERALARRMRRAAAREWEGPRPIRFDAGADGRTYTPPWVLAAESGRGAALYPHGAPQPEGELDDEAALRAAQGLDDPAALEARLEAAWREAEELVRAHGLEGQVQWRALSPEEKKDAFFGRVGTFRRDYYPEDPDYLPELHEGSTAALDHDPAYAPHTLGPVWAYYVDKLRPNWDPRYGPYPQEDAWPVLPPDANPMEGTVWQTDDEREQLQDYLNEGYY